MEIKALIENLTDNGCSREGTLRAKALYEAGDIDGLIKHLRRCRCDLEDEIMIKKEELTLVTEWD